MSTSNPLCEAGSAKTRSLKFTAIQSANRTFFKSPFRIQKPACPMVSRVTARGERIWGTNSAARTMGPATSCGKKDT